jgi:hypothetical protein
VKSLDNLLEEVNQPTNLYINQFTNQLNNLYINQPNNQPNNLYTNQFTNQPNNQEVLLILSFKEELEESINLNLDTLKKKYAPSRRSYHTIILY